MKKKYKILIKDILGLSLAIIIFIVPFLFMLSNSLKGRREANLLNLSFPKTPIWSNFLEVIKTDNYSVLIAFKNSILLTFFSLVPLIIFSSMAGYIIQRRNDKKTKIINSIIMAGLMLPPAILPTIWIMKILNIYKTMFSMAMIETAIQLPFTIMLYRGFMSTIPRELEEAAFIDGCKRTEVFSKIVFPLLKPITATVIILDAVSIFNDFMNPLYFFPGKKNLTVQLTLYNFMGKFDSSYNLLFADTIIITIPMLILFIIFNKRIVSGMSMGAIKG